MSILNEVIKSVGRQRSKDTHEQQKSDVFAKKQDIARINEIWHENIS